MAGIDLIVTWPTNCDYPLWRKWVKANRARFDQVIVAFSPMPGHADCSHGVMQMLDGADITFLHTRWEDGWDWRDAAVNEALRASKADWVWFTEQDFRIVEPDNFWRTVYAHLECKDAIGVRQDVRWHPCCLFVNRAFMEDIPARYFGSDPVDHFYAFGLALENAAARIVNIDAFWPYTYTHMAGLSHNHNLVERGERVTYKPDEFAAYLQECLDSGVELLAGWRVRAEQFLSSYHASGG